MGKAVFHRLAVRASMCDGDSELRRARLEAAAGDESWQRWVDEHGRGEALVLSIRTSLEVHRDGASETFEVVNDGIWVENDVHPPVVAEQVRQVVGKDFSALRRRLAKREVEADDDLLGRLLIEVELGDDVRRELRSHGPSRGHEPKLSPGAAPD